MAGKKVKLEPGARFGDWTLVRDLEGKGGNSTVWEAQHGSGNQGAIKFLHEHLVTGNPKKLQRFRDEINFLRQHTDDPGVLTLLDSHSPPQPSVADRPWLVTPLAIPASKQFAGGARPLGEVVGFLQVIAATLARLHAKGVYHRDIKPDNLFLLDGMPVVGDFGLVDMPGKTPVTEPAEPMGPRYYIAPEMLSDAADIPAGPADVYSLAKTLWVLASGQRFPPPGHQNRTVAALTLGAYVGDPRGRLLDTLLDRCTHQLPQDRPAMSEVVVELAAWLNPPSQSPATPDLPALMGEVKAAMDETRLLQAESARRKAEVDEAVALMRPTVEAIRLQFAQMAGVNPHASDTRDFLPHLRVGQQHGYIEPVFLRVDRSGSTTITLAVGGVAQNAPGGMLEIAAGIVLLSEGRATRVLYSQKHLVAPGSALLQSRASELCRGLEEGLPAAVKAFVEQCQLYPAAAMPPSER